MPEVVDSLDRNDARKRAALISNVSYDVSLTLSKDMDEKAFRSVSTVTFETSAASTGTFIDIAASAINSVTVNGRTLRKDEYSFDGERRIVFTSLPKGATTVTVDATIPYSTNGEGLHRFEDSEDHEIYLHSDFEPFNAHRMFACFDQPDLKATYSFHVDAPKEWTVISNAAIASTKDSGAMRHTDFATTEPISTYLSAVVAGPYAAFHDTYNGIPLTIYCRKSLVPYVTPPEIAEMFETTKQGLAFYENLFGIPYPFPKYDQLFVPEFNAGAMENPGCTTFREDYIFRGQVTEAEREDRAVTQLHEMAHMWFGDYSTMKWWDDLWLNESFATYMSYMAVSTATRFKNAWVGFANGEKSWAFRQDQLPTTHPIAADAPDTETAKTNFDGITYAKGAAVLRQLGAFIGEKSFFQGVREYFAAHAWGNGSLADFLAALGHASGRDLSSWAKDWLETSGMSTLSMKTTESNGKYTGFVIEQTATKEHPTLRSHRLGIGCYSLVNGALVLTKRVQAEVGGSATSILALVGADVPDLVVLNDGDLAFAKVRFDPRSFTTLMSHLSDIEDPLTRALCWSTVWDMTRDSELSVSDFVRLVAEQAPREPELATVQRLILQAYSATMQYADPANRACLLELLATQARTTFEHAAPGSDVQLAWFKGFVKYATSASDVATLSNLLAGSVSLPGIDLAKDRALRWTVVKQLASKGALTRQQIQKEKDADSSDLGNLSALSAFASIPTAAAKAAAWKSLFSDPLTLYERTEVIRGFNSPGQEQLLEKYADLYFKELPAMWKKFDEASAEAMTDGLFPASIVTRAVQQKASRLAKSKSTALPFTAKRSLLEMEDTMGRTLKTREKDALSVHSESRKVPALEA